MLGTDLIELKPLEFMLECFGVRGEGQEGQIVSRGTIGEDEGKTSEGCKPMSGSSMKQGWEDRRGMKRQEAGKA